MYLNNCHLIGALSGGVDCQSGYVEIRDGRISSVGEQLPEGAAEVYDCGGGTLLPGLIDLHTHITLLSNVGISCSGDPMQVLVDASAQAKRYLRHGFTTIRDCGSIGRAANYVKKLIAGGVFDGPDLITCGRTLMPSVQNSLNGLAAMNHFCDGVEEFRKGTREEIANGAEFIKIYASGSALLPTGVPLHPIMTFEEIKSAVDTARTNGLSVAAHCHADSAISDCIRAGVHTIEHATYLSERTTDLLMEAEDTYLVPTFAAMYVSQTDPKEREFWLARLNPMLESCAAAIERAYRSGAVLGFGTDSAPMSPQYEKGVEFQFRKEYCHMENLDILLQATKYSAQIAGISHRVGEIKNGLAADLVLVNGDPAADISVMYSEPEKVWKNGTLVIE